jgi:hypothetical protein
VDVEGIVQEYLNQDKYIPKFNLDKSWDRSEFQKLIGDDWIISKSRRTELRGAFGGGMLRRSSLLPDNANVGDNATYWRMYKDEAPIRGAITVIVNAVVSQGWKVKTAKKDDVDEHDEKVKEITAWLSHPDREFQNVLRDLILNLIIHDNSFAEVRPHEFNNDDEMENVGWIYPLDSRDVEWSSNKRGTEVTKIVHQVEGKESKYEPTTLVEGQYIHLALNKAGAAHGLSSLESLVASADLLHSAHDYNQDMFDSNGVPAMAFILEEGGPDDWNILTEQTKNIKQGQCFTAKGKIKPIVLGGKQNEIGYTELVEQVYQDVMTVYQIPPVLMSKPGASTLESSREETSSFSMNIGAIQFVANNAIDRFIIMVWGEEYSEIRFELGRWVNEKAQAAIDDIYAKIGVFTPNMTLRRMGREPVWWGDVPYNPNAPLGQGMPDPLELARVSAQAKPQGSQDQAEGRPAETERPQNQGRESSPTKDVRSDMEVDYVSVINDLVNLSTAREKQLAEMTEVIKSLTQIIENKELASSYITAQYKRLEDVQEIKEIEEEE